MFKGNDYATIQHSPAHHKYIEPVYQGAYLNPEGRYRITYRTYTFERQVCLLTQLLLISLQWEDAWMITAGEFFALRSVRHSEEAC